MESVLGLGEVTLAAPLLEQDPEVVHGEGYPDHATARRAIFAWINTYNHRRLHSSLGYMPPVEWENQYRQSPADLAA